MRSSSRKTVIAAVFVIVTASYALTIPKESIIAFSVASLSATWIIAALSALFSLYLLLWRLPLTTSATLKTRRAQRPITYSIAAIIGSGLAAMLSAHLAGGVIAALARFEGRADRVFAEAIVRDTFPRVFYHRWIGCGTPLEVQFTTNKRARFCLRWPVESSVVTSRLEPGDMVVLTIREGKLASVLERIEVVDGVEVGD